MTNTNIYQTVNPTNLETIETYERFTPHQLEATLDLATGAHAIWKTTRIEERKAYLLAVGENLNHMKETLAKQMALEMGKPLADGRAEIDKCISTCQYYAENLEDLLSGEIVSTNYKKSAVRIESLGVILCIMPWNFPCWQVIRFAIPALALGNTVLLKHSEITAGTAVLLEKAFAAWGTTLLLYNCPVDHETAAEVLADPRVRAATFTGSERGGREVAITCARNIKKSVLELGGADAYFVLEDADLGAAIKSCTEARLVNNGQSCVAGKRFFVPQKSMAEFTEGLRNQMHRFPIGNPLEEKNKLGPLAQLKFRKDIQAQINEVQKRATDSGILVSAPEAAAFFSPQYLTFPLATPDVHAMEIFGPVFSIFPYEKESEALHWINSSPFGLGGAIFSRDLDRALLLASEFESGMVVINDSVKSDPRLPFGGVKHSGYGRELGHWGFYEFANIKSVSLG